MSTSTQERLSRAASLTPGMLVRHMGGEFLVAGDPFTTKTSGISVVPLINVNRDHVVYANPDDVTILLDICNLGHLLLQARFKFKSPLAWLKHWPDTNTDMSGKDHSWWELVDGLGRRLVPGPRVQHATPWDAFIHALEYDLDQ